MASRCESHTLMSVPLPARLEHFNLAGFESQRLNAGVVERSVVGGAREQDRLASRQNLRPAVIRLALVRGFGQRLGFATGGGDAVESGAHAAQCEDNVVVF